VVGVGDAGLIEGGPELAIAGQDLPAPHRTRSVPEVLSDLGLAD
jgi:hypothetical protein